MKNLFLLICLIILPLSNTVSQTWEELHEKTNQYYDKGDYDTAISYAEKALNQCEIEFGKDHPNYGVSTYDLGGLYFEIGRYEEALELYLKSLQNTKKFFGKDHPDYGMCLNDLALLYKVMGRYEKALPLYLESLENAEKNFGKDNSEYGIRLDNLASLYRTMGRYQDALPLCLESLKIIEKSLGKENPDYASVLNNVAGLYQEMGHYEEALPYYLEARENAERNLGGDHPDYGTYLFNLAGLYQEMGRYKDALPIYLKALENTEKNLGKNHPDYAVCLNNLASLYQAMGRFEEALPLYLKALENTEKSLGKDHYEYGIYLNNLAGLYEDMNRYEEALQLYLKALENTEKSLGKDHSYYANRLNNLARFYQKIDRFHDALDLYLEALEIMEKSLGKENFQYNNCLNNIAEVYQAMGRYEEALPLYLEAFENIKERLGKDHFYLGTHLNNLALLYETMGRYEEALPLYLEANSNLHKQIKNIFSFSSENEKKAFFKTLSRFFEIYQSFHYKTSGNYSIMAGMLYDNQLILKGLLLTSSKNMLSAIRENAGNEATEMYNQWIGIRRHLAQQYSLPITERVSNLDSLETEANKLEGKLVSLSEDFMTEKKGEDITWKDVQKNLGKDDIAIEFARFRYYDTNWTDSTLYLAYIVTTETGHPEIVYLFEEKELNNLIKHTTPNKLYALRGGQKLSVSETGESGEDLYSLIIKPLEKYLEGKKRIYFSTDGKLHQLSFAAFSTKQGELLCGKYDLMQLNSTGEIALGENKPGKEPAVLVGGIKFEYSADKATTTDSSGKYAYNFLEDESIKQSRSNRGGGTEWPYLPGTEAEVEKLMKIFNENGLLVDTLTGIYATEESIKKLDGNSPKVLHMATHGFFFESPEDRKITSIDQKESYSISEDPLMRSGLILAGGNYAWKNGSNPYEKEDGILTAYEISNLNLLKTDLVVLSACETGLGDIEGSEGVYGLQRAFRISGVKDLIMSLWQVPDKETVEFMQTFYGKWIEGDDIRDAFNKTQKLMSKRYTGEPEKWAAFVLLE